MESEPVPARLSEAPINVVSRQEPCFLLGIHRSSAKYWSSIGGSLVLLISSAGP